ncbi:MAG: DUF3793 family protein [Chitinophagales bacterium]
MYKYLFLLFLIVSSNSIVAQENSVAQIKKKVDVPIIAYWQKGDIWKYIAQKGKLTYKGDQISSKETTQYDISCEVIDSNEHSYTLQWVYDAIAFTHENVTQNTFKQKAAKALEKQIFTFQTDEYGRFDTILNYSNTAKNIREKVQEALKEADDLTQFMLKETLTKQSDYELMENNFSDVVNYHAYHGYEFRADTSFSYTSQQENAMGGTIDSQGTSSIKLDEENKSILVIEDTLIPDMDQIIPQTKKLLMQLGNVKKKEIDKLINKETSKVEKSERYVFDHEYGLLLEYEHTDTKSFGGDTTVKFALLKILN